MAIRLQSRRRRIPNPEDASFFNLICLIFADLFLDAFEKVEICKRCYHCVILAFYTLRAVTRTIDEECWGDIRWSHIEGWRNKIAQANARMESNTFTGSHH